MALAALALGILRAADAVAAPQRIEEERILERWTETGAFAYVPTGPNGTRPMGEPGYFTTTSPQLALDFRWRVDDARASATGAYGEMELRIESARWTHVVPLANATMTAGEPELALHGLLDFALVEADLARALASQARRAEPATWKVVATVHAVRTLPDGPATSEAAFVLPLDYDAPLYVLPGEAQAQETKDHTRREVVTHEWRAGARGLLADPVGPGLVLAGVSGLVLAAGAGRAPPSRKEARA